MTRAVSPASAPAAAGLLFVLCLVAGCGTSSRGAKAPSQPFKGATLNVAVVGDPAPLAGLNAQRGEWERKNAAEVRPASAPYDPASGKPRGIDVLLFPGERLGDLLDVGALVSIPDAAMRPPRRDEEDADTSAAPTGSGERPIDPYDFADVLPAFRDQMTKSGDTRIALPYGGSALVLAYRRDVFENDTLKRAAAEAKVSLEPPKTWTALDALAKFLNGRDWSGDGKPDAGIAIVTADDPEGVGAATFFARAAAVGQHPDQFSFLFDDDTMAPEIAGPPFVEALAAFRELEQLGPDPGGRLTAEAARAAFREGRVALLIDRAERYGTWNDPKAPVAAGIAALPGSERVFDPETKAFQPASPLNRPAYLPFGGGWLVGVASSCPPERRDAAIDFLKDLTSPEASARIIADRAFPMLPTRMSHLGAGMSDPRSAPGVDPRTWGRAVAETLTAGRVIPGLRIPDSAGYLADLSFDRGATGEREPAEALKAVADAWAERTKKHGVERMLWHYRRSLNRPTLSEDPPPRTPTKGAAKAS